MTCLNRWIIALAALIWFFSWMNLQMPFQIAWPNSCKITLVALVRLFIRVYFLMSLQIANLRRCKATLVTFVRLLIVLIFQRDSHHIWRSAHPGGKYWLTYKPTIKLMFMFDRRIIQTFTFLQESRNIPPKLLFQSQIRTKRIKRICLHKCW